MKKMLLSMLILLLMSFTISAQNTNSNTTAKTSVNNANSNSTKRPPIFRANKEQITQAQSMLKQRGFYTEEASGKLDETTREALKKYQETEKIRATGTLNRITLEKMGVKLTDKQKLLPVSESSLSPDNEDSKKTRSAIFRATKDQIMQAQKMLINKKLYKGAQDGKMNDEFRDALKKYQETEKIKITGTLNQETLSKMGIELTSNQKALQTSAAKRT